MIWHSVYSIRVWFCIFLYVSSYWFWRRKKKRIFMFADVDQSYIATSLVATVHNTRVVCMIVSFFNPLLCPPPLYFPSFYFANRVDKLWCVFDSHTESFVIPPVENTFSLSLLFSFMSRNH